MPKNNDYDDNMANNDSDIKMPNNDTDMANNDRED